MEIDPKRAQSHTDSLLARQVSTAVRGALRATHQASKQILDTWQAPESIAVDWDEVADRAREFNELTEEIDVSAESGRGLVNVTLRGNTGVDIAVKPRSLDNFGLATVAAEISDGLSRASRLRTQEVRRAHRTAYLDKTARA
ncbi:hypothetical protein [Stackebrandtia nassauensis]|uniref:hypothetical protein n=1 Tax=Stackebrandtia nassauensis TaxID=283811 RepID=UPI001186EB09|nr:hypothetical protein [Stackebrandtia nassauensis]